MSEKQQKVKEILKNIDKIFSFIDNQGISVAEFERRAGLGGSYLAKTRLRGTDITQKVLDKIQKNAPDYFAAIFSRGEKREVFLTEEHEKSAQDLSNQKALISLTESTQKLSDANLINARNIDRLIALLENRANLNAPVDNPLTSPAIFPQILVTLAEIGSGKKWRSIEEASAFLHKRFSDALLEKRGVGTPIG